MITSKKRFFHTVGTKPYVGLYLESSESSLRIADDEEELVLDFVLPFSLVGPFFFEI